MGAPFTVVVMNSATGIGERDPLAFTIGKVSHCIGGECLRNILNTGDYWGQGSTREATLELVQRKQVLDICRRSEN